MCTYVCARGICHKMTLVMYLCWKNCLFSSFVSELEDTGMMQRHTPSLPYLCWSHLNYGNYCGGSDSQQFLALHCWFRLTLNSMTDKLGTGTDPRYAQIHWTSTFFLIKMVWWQDTVMSPVIYQTLPSLALTPPFLLKGHTIWYGCTSTCNVQVHTNIFHASDPTTLERWHVMFALTVMLITPQDAT